MCKEIPRCKKTLTREEFFRLKGIHDDNPWLEYENVLGLYELWNLTSNENQKELLEFLIGKFLYVDSVGLLGACKSIANQVEQQWGLFPERTIITAVCDNSDPDGSQFLLQAVKNKFSGVWKRSFCNAITIAAHNVKDNFNLVVLDDFIGTGKKIERKINYLKNTFDNRGVTGVNFYVISLAAMSFSKDRILSITPNVYSYIWLYKGISELAPIEKKDMYIKEMFNLEGLLKWSNKQRRLLSLGYEQSETLFSLVSNNVPNNVFPIFWWRMLKPNIERLPILRRL